MTKSSKPSRKLQKAPPLERLERYREILSLDTMPEPQRMTRKFTKAPPRPQGLITSLTSATNQAAFPPQFEKKSSVSSSYVSSGTSDSLKRQTAGSDPTGDLVDPVSTLERKESRRSNRLARALKTMKLPTIKKMEPVLPAPQELTDTQLLIAIVDEPIMSEYLKVLRKAQITAIHKVLADFDHHIALLNRTVAVRTSTKQQVLQAINEIQLIEPTGRKLRLFLTLIRLEDDINNNTIFLKDRSRSAPAYKELIEHRKGLEREIQITLLAFNVAYNDLASRDRDKLEDFHWTIFDQYGDLVFDDWPLTYLDPMRKR